MRLSVYTATSEISQQRQLCSEPHRWRTWYSAVWFIVSSCVPLYQENQALSRGTTVVSCWKRTITNLSRVERLSLYREFLVSLSLLMSARKMLFAL